MYTSEIEPQSEGIKKSIDSSATWFNITAVRSDKGGEVVVMKTATLDSLITDHLNG